MVSVDRMGIDLFFNHYHLCTSTDAQWTWHLKKRGNNTKHWLAIINFVTQTPRSMAHMYSSVSGNSLQHLSNNKTAYKNNVKMLQNTMNIKIQQLQVKIQGGPKDRGHCTRLPTLSKHLNKSAHNFWYSSTPIIFWIHLLTPYWTN